VWQIVLSFATRRAIASQPRLQAWWTAKTWPVVATDPPAVFETPLIFSFGAPDFSLSIAQ
jgi:hypothetical protein